jgi:serine/threonine protein kinase
MMPERWHQITEIFHAALARDAGGREAYLQEACRHDSALRAEVDQLLAGHHDAGSSFGETTAYAVAAGPVQRLEAGTSLGPYRIEALLGAGGMGEVYRARDTRLGRDVAVKVLPELFRDDPERRRRFEREARAISSLKQPHICTLHDVGDHEGMPYLVMELVDGETLAQRLDRGAMPLEQAFRCGIEVASALDRAHREGIVHRDLKPGNVMLTKMARSSSTSVWRSCTGWRAATNSGGRPQRCQARMKARFSERCTTWPLNSSKAGRSTRAPISSRLARCCTKSSPDDARLKGIVRRA